MNAQTEERPGQQIAFQDYLLAIATLQAHVTTCGKPEIQQAYDTIVKYFLQASERNARNLDQIKVQLVGILEEVSPITKELDREPDKE